MLKYTVDFIYKIRLYLNKIRFTSTKNVNVGRNFKLANYTTFLIHQNSEVNIGNEVEIRNYFNLVIKSNSKIEIENNVFINNNCSINCLSSIFIGENTLLGENVKIYDHNHKYEAHKIFHKDFTTSPISIGKNCWLGSNVTILKGVKIGNNVIIGAGCIIYKNVPDNSIIINKQEYLNLSNN